MTDQPSDAVPQQDSLDLPVTAPAEEIPVEPEGFDVEDFPGGARSTIEAILMVVDQPLTALDLADSLELEVDAVTAHLQALDAEYAEQQRGFTLREINGGWRVYSRADYAPAVEKFLMGGQQAKLTQASLETLAVIAYRQPISRARVSAVRGVNVDGVIRTLTTRGLIAETGTDGEGGAMLYGTTPYFLQRMGLSSLDELPALAPYLPEIDVIDELIEQGHA